MLFFMWVMSPSHVHLSPLLRVEWEWEWVFNHPFYSPSINDPKDLMCINGPFSCFSGIGLCEKVWSYICCFFYFFFELFLTLMKFWWGIVFIYYRIIITIGFSLNIPIWICIEIDHLNFATTLFYFSNHDSLNLSPIHWRNINEQKHIFHFHIFQIPTASW